MERSTPKKFLCCQNIALWAISENRASSVKAAQWMRPLCCGNTYCQGSSMC